MIRIFFPILFLLLVAGETRSQLQIHSEDHSGYTRALWPVTGGVPFAKGQLHDVKNLSINDHPVQSRVLSKWSDGSVKWALIDYQTDIPANTRIKHQLVITEQPAVRGISLMETSTAITVNTGVLKFSVSKITFGFLQHVFLDLNKNGRYEPDEEIVKKEKGQEHSYDLQENNPERPTIPYAERNLLTGTSKPLANGMPVNEGGSVWIRNEGGGKESRIKAGKDHYSATVLEHGPLRTVIQLKGRFGPSENDNEYRILIHAYRGKSFISVQHHFIFRGDPQTTNIRRMGLKLPLYFSSQPSFTSPGKGESVKLKSGGSAYLLTQGPENVFNLEHKGFPLNWESVADNKKISGTDKTGGWIDVSTEKFGVTLAFRDMAMKYPKELSFDASKNLLNAWIWPDHGKQVLDLRASGWPDGIQGVGFSHELLYAFHGKEKQDYSEQLVAMFNDPIQPYADPETYSYNGTKAAGMLMPFDDIQFPRTEAYLATGTAFIERSMTEFGWLGMLNYGDLMFMYGYNKEPGKLGTWGISSRRDDYDGWRRGNTMIGYRMLMQYLRTGEYQYWKAASAEITFVRDALIKHYSSRDPRFTGFGRRHSAYWGSSMMAEIDRPGGVAYDGYGTDWLAQYMHWNLTGDWRTYEVINEIRSAWNSWGNTDVDQISGGAYVGLKMISSIPGYEKTKDEADRFLDMAVKRTSNPGDFWRDCTWFMGYGIYLQDVDDPVIHKAVLDWWKPGTYKPDEWGLYWHREALSAVYWSAGKRKDIRDSIYAELSRYGSTENQQTNRIQKQLELFRIYGVNGLFRCDMSLLAETVAPVYWRAKDDIMQMQWDEPLSMAVISHYQKNYLKKN